MTWRKASIVSLLLTLMFTFGTTASAGAEVRWDVKSFWGPTVLQPGGSGMLTILVLNVGDSTSSGQVQVVEQLPPGVSASTFDTQGWACAYGSGTVTCKLNEEVEPWLQSAAGATLKLQFRISASLGASGVGDNVVTLSGGGGQPDQDVDPIAFGENPGFGIIPSSVEGGSFSRPRPLPDVEQQAGGHPYEVRIDFDFNEMYGVTSPTTTPPNALFTAPSGRVRTVETVLPRGLIGNPESVPKCTAAELNGEGQYNIEATGCPVASQVGTMRVLLSGGPAEGGWWFPSQFTRVGIYNMEPSHGHAADFGYNIGGYVTGHIYANLDAAHGYAIKAVSPYISNIAAVRGVEVTLWGVPGDSSHDPSRWFPATYLPNGEKDESAPVAGAHLDPPYEPFFTLPADCGFDNGPFYQSADSWNHPGVFTEQLPSKDHLIVSGCDDPRIRFKPQVSLQPTSRAAGGPTGLAVHLEVPQRDQAVSDPARLYPENGDLHGIDTPPMKKAVVTLPEGMTLSTSAAQGLGSCSADQIGLGTDSPVQCPENSRYGSLTLHTPLLPHDEPMRGDIYIAKQDENPFGTFLALYFVIHDEDRGLLVKLPGRIDLDPVTGQITTTFDDLPQFPLEDMEVTFKSGVRAALVNPPTCGTKTIRAEFFSWHDPDTPVVKTSSYDVTEKPDGSPCVQNLAERPFRPILEAGTVNPSAGAYSPFVFRLVRADDDQEFSQVQATLPPGLIAKLAGLSRCPDAAIAAAQAPGRTGTQEQLSPSCPATSEIGTTDVGSGVGQALTYLPGKIYLAGPYQGSPLSMIVITPVVTGPYDLGVIAVRTAIQIDPRSTRVSVRSEPLPQIYRGIPVRIRDIRVKVDRPETMLNPTSCDVMEVGSSVTGAGGDLASLADDTVAGLHQRFQLGNCASLGFGPRLSLRLKGGTKRGDFPALRAVLRPRSGDANIARSVVTLPKSEFIEQGHIRNPCTRVQFAAGACPPGSVYGHAVATTPLLDEPLRGPVYLRSNGGERELPDLVAALHGQIDAEVVGYIDSRGDGRIRTTFAEVPDVPVTKFVLKMPGGKRGLLTNSQNLCAGPHRAAVEFDGHNGKIHDFATPLRTQCRKGGKQRAKHRARPGR